MRPLILPRPTLDLSDEAASALLDAIRLDGWWALGTLLVNVALYIAAPAMAQMAHQQNNASGRIPALVLGGYSLLRCLLAFWGQRSVCGIWACAVCSLPSWGLLLTTVILTAAHPLLLAGALCLLLLLFASQLRILPKLLLILHWQVPVQR